MTGAASSKIETAAEQAKSDGRRAGAMAERERWRVVIASPEARYKYRTAVSILKHTDLDADAIRKLLSDLGEGSA